MHYAHDMKNYKHTYKYGRFLLLAVAHKALYKLNTSYLTDSFIDFTLKMESVPESTIFGLNMMAKSGLKKYF